MSTMDPEDRKLLLETHAGVARLNGRLDEALPAMDRRITRAADAAYCAKRKAGAAEKGNRLAATTIGAGVSAAVAGLVAGLKSLFN